MLLHYIILSEKEDEQVRQRVVNGGNGACGETQAKREKMEAGIKGGKDVIGVQLIVLTRLFAYFVIVSLEAVERGVCALS